MKKPSSALLREGNWLPTSAETYQQVAEIIDSSLQQSGISKLNAWKGVWRALLWYDPIGNRQSVPHIIDADKTWHPKFRSQAIPDPKPRPWVTRAKNVEKQLANEFGCPTSQVAKQVDQLMRTPSWTGLQRQNPLGIGCVGATVHLLRRFGDETLTHETEVDASTIFPGISLPGRAASPKIDIVSYRSGSLVAITSCKWGLRHDRVGDITSECPAYKNAAMRQRTSGKWKGPNYSVVTNEFDPARLTKLLTDPCVDGVAHIHKEAVTKWCGLDSRLSSLMDLVDYLDSTYKW